MHVHKQRKLVDSVFILKLEEDFKLVSFAVKNDIMVSCGISFCLGLFHLLFSLSVSGLFVWKNQERSISHVYCVPAFPVLESPVFFFFLISIFVGATAQHPQHTDDKEGWGSRKAGYTNIVPEEEKEETIRIQ